jgi:hypothetical protein
MFNVIKSHTNDPVEDGKQLSGLLHSGFTPLNSEDERNRKDFVQTIISKDDEEISTVGNVATWSFLEVQKWAMECGFTEDIVLYNIHRYKINGGDMVKIGITASELGVSDKKAYNLQIKKLRLRYNGEKSKYKRKLAAENVQNKKMKKKAEVSEEEGSGFDCDDEEKGVGTQMS